jgi:hypothetical protein
MEIVSLRPHFCKGASFISEGVSNMEEVINVVLATVTDSDERQSSEIGQRRRGKNCLISDVSHKGAGP